MSDTSNFMFSAKRLDNGDVIKGRLGYDMSGMDIIQVSGCNLIIYKIDPSTIKPLFTTAATEDVWLFENVERKVFRDLSGDEMKLISDEIENDSIEYFYDGTDHGTSMTWQRSTDSSIDRFLAYRVKAPAYELVDAHIDMKMTIRDTAPDNIADDCRAILNKFAKANGLWVES